MSRWGERFRYAGPAAMGLAVLGGLYAVGLYSYLLFHCLAEVFSILVAWGIFVIAWNTRNYHDNGYFVLLGIAYLFVGGIDLAHTLTYKGMDIFPGLGANLATQLWIVARYLESMSLLIAPWFLNRYGPNRQAQLVSPRRSLARYVFATYALISGAAVALILFGLFPACYVDGVGLTAFKKISEYVICAILVVAAVGLARHRRALDPQIFVLLVLSILVTIAAELAFTTYVSVYGVANLIGHLLKIVAFYLIYKAIIEIGLVNPFRLLFRNLKQSEADLFRRAVELEARNTELDAFAHTVAHDLKSPLAVMISYADFTAQFYETLNPDDVQQSLVVIVQNGRKMSNIVQELLLLAGVRKMDAPVESFETGPIIDEVLRRLDDLIREVEAIIEQPEVWPLALGYAPWVEEVWVNYLSNALQYGGRPPQITLGADIQPDGRVRFWVRDRGPGIAEEQQARLFTPFTQFAQVHTEGHGLGLSIVRRIIDKLGGQVGVDSAVGQGSTFWFILNSVLYS
ncbi:MAG: hypothetical protein JW934_03860 [Anaerolineae bacterium]|nr:hypothetical protein [Anaerolineae bacterium]